MEQTQITGRPIFKGVVYRDGNPWDGTSPCKDDNGTYDGEIHDHEPQEFPDECLRN